MGIKTKLRVALQVMVNHRGQILGAIGISILLVMVIAVVYGRKLADAMMAIAIERRLTKEQIFALYCDRIYLGHNGAT